MSLVVGIKIWGKSNVKPNNNITLERCVTYKELGYYDICLLENCPKEEVDKVKELKNKVYSIGATHSDIALITIPIKDINEIISEDKAIENEKQRSVEAIRKATNEKIEAEKARESLTQNVSDLREKLDNQRSELESLKQENEKLKEELSETQLKLGAEVDLKEKAKKELEEYKEELGNTVIQNKVNLSEREKQLNQEKATEIDKIKQVLALKESIIEEQGKENDELKNKIKELSKSGAIPDINFKYDGDAKIIGVMSHGSYGVSNLVYSIARILEDKDILIVDLDMKGGNLQDYVKNDSKCIEKMLKGNECYKETLVRSKSGRQIDYVGGVSSDWSPSDVIMLNFEKIFEGKYQTILVDCGINGGYNIQTKICEMIMQNGRMINLYTREEKQIKNCINIKNFDRKGIPYISRLFTEHLAMCDEPIVKQKVIDMVIKEIIK